MPFRLFAVLVLGLLWFGCESEVDPDVDTITIGAAASGDLRAVLNGNEEVRKKVVHIMYDKIYNRLHFFVEFENGVMLQMECSYQNARSAEGDTALWAYVWDPRRMDITPWVVHQEKPAWIAITLDTAAKIMSDTFVSHTGFPKEEWNSRFSQGSFTDIPYTEQESEAYSYSFTMSGVDWIDSNMSFSKNDVMYRPMDDLYLSFEHSSSNTNGILQSAQVNFSLSDAMLSIGELDLAKIKSVSCNIHDPSTTHLPKDSLLNGKLIITALDRTTQRISGTFDFVMRTSDSLLQVKGSFVDQYWLEIIKKD